MTLDWILFTILVLYTSIEVVAFVFTDDCLLPDAVVFFSFCGVVVFGMPTVFFPAYSAIHGQLPPGSDFAKLLVSFSTVLFIFIAYYIAIAISSAVVQDLVRTRKSKTTTPGRQPA